MLSRLSNSRSSLRPLSALSCARTFVTNRVLTGQYGLETYLVSPAELNEALKRNVNSKLSTSPKIVPLCASWFLPNDGRVGKDTYLAERIPRAQFFDLDAVKDAHSPYPHMLPSTEDFAVAMRKLGIRRHDSVVVYDSKELGIFSAPRVGWTLQAFGHPNVHVLNNFRKWVEEGYPTESGKPIAVDEVDYPVPQLDKTKVVAFEEVREIAKEQGLEGAEEVQILDARSLGRWKGTDPEPREGRLTLHISLAITPNKPRSLLRPHPSLYLRPHLRPPRRLHEDPPSRRQAKGSLRVQEHRCLEAHHRQLRHRRHGSRYRRRSDQGWVPHRTAPLVRRELDRVGAESEAHRGLDPQV
jgi:thiosulfate/3-mercaptopyruvate sulfurtransferase